MNDKTMRGEFSIHEDDVFDPVNTHLPQATVTPAQGVSALALTLAVKYHGVNIIQDGQLYQQYKLEGKEIRDLTLEMIFETAEKMEKWLLNSNERIAQIIVDAIDSSSVEEIENDKSDN